MTVSMLPSFELGPLPTDRRMTTVDEQLVHAPLARVFALAADVARWPDHLPHYRYVRFRAHAPDGGGIVEMAANRPFGSVQWPTWWVSEMEVRRPAAGVHPCVRFRHIEGITTGMDVAWEFAEAGGGTHVRVVHVWNGPSWPLIRTLAARGVIGPVFVHGIASRTLAGIARAAERDTRAGGTERGTS